MTRYTRLKYKEMTPEQVAEARKAFGSKGGKTKTKNTKKRGFGSNRGLAKQAAQKTNNKRWGTPEKGTII